MNNALNILKKYWGYDSFRASQEDIINTLLDNNNTFAILPTGGGKSLCYQIPALLKPGCTLVISPLIALMNDQIQDLKSRGIPAEVIHSGLSIQEIKDTLESACHGELKFIYCSPERLNNDLFLDYAQDILWNYLIIDEAHCISQWGHDFRPQYLNIHSFRKHCPDITVGAFTASATIDTQKEIVESLMLKDVKKFIGSVYRENISYQVLSSNHKEKTLFDNIAVNSNIVYCNTRKSTESTAEFLTSKSIPASYYHAGLSNKERQFIQQQWITSHQLTICSTNAFGMGINKPDVRQVFHLHIPLSLEAYYQEAGRAGRDEQPAEAMLLTIPHDQHVLLKSIEDKFPSINIIKHVYDLVCQHLKIAYNDGYEEKYFIDLSAFQKKTDFNIIQILSAIKILETENYWVFNQDDTSSHYIQIICGRNELNFLEQHYPKLYHTIIQFLRLYGDIMHYPTPVSIELVASINKTTYDDVILDLEEIAKFKFIKWKKHQKGSSLFFTQARVPKDFLSLNAKKIAWRKELFKQKVSKMIEYAFKTTSCRQQFMAEYFGEKNTTACQRCDNCLDSYFDNNKEKFLSDIYHFIKEKKSVSLNELSVNYKLKITLNKLKSVLNNLRNDDLIDINGTLITSR